MPLPIPHRAARRSRPAFAGLTLAVAAVVLTACTVGPSTRPPLATFGGGGTVAVPQSSVSTMPTGPGGPGQTADPISWTDCPTEIASTDQATGRTFTLQCGQVEVPKSYSTAGSGDLAVAVAKATSTDTPPNAPPLVVVLGNPGSNGTHRIAAVAARLPAEILGHFQVIVMDVRGTGDSVPIDCVSGKNSGDLLSLGADPTTSTAGKLLADLSRSITFDCGDMVGPDLSDYSTVLASDDLDSIRAALGTKKVSVLGQGFGATLAAVYADRYPGRVNAAVLDGPSDPSLTPDKVAALTATAAEKALGSFAAACATFSGGCPLGSDPAGEVKALITKLGDVGETSTDDQEVTGGSVLAVLAYQLGHPAGWPDLAKALAAARDDNVDALAALLLEPLGTDNVERQQSGEIVYRCNDSAQRLGGTALDSAVKTSRAAAPVFGPFLLGLVGVCSSWPAPETALGRVTATGAPPILILGAVDDPVSPYSEAKSLTAQLDSATLLTWQSGTDGSYGTSSCMTAAADAYLLKGTVPAAGTLCPP